MNSNYILVTRLDERTSNAKEMQKILSESGCSIKARLGLHETSEDYCSTSGIIILQLFTDLAGAKELEKQLASLPGIQAQLVDLN